MSAKYCYWSVATGEYGAGGRRLQRISRIDRPSAGRLREFFRQEGLVSPVYLSRSAFWIIQHDAIEPVSELALRFWRQAKEAGLSVGVDAALGYAMHLLCADPEAHQLGKHPDLWAGAEGGQFRDALPEGVSWAWRHSIGNAAIPVRPAMMHLPRTQALFASVPESTRAAASPAQALEAREAAERASRSAAAGDSQPSRAGSSPPREGSDHRPTINRLWCSRPPPRSGCRRCSTRGRAFACPWRVPSGAPLRRRSSPSGG